VIEIPEWPYFLGLPEARGVIRCSPEDFVVEEIARVQPLGEGTHLWLWVEKRGANTDWVAGELARVTGCARRDVGYAGLKDRHAVTRQWFSVAANETTNDSINTAEIEGVSILETSLHTRKLKRGTLDGNRFELTIRNFSGDATQTEQRLQQIQATGVPNYFGPQRFGHGGRNVDRGLSLLSTKARLPRNKKSIYLSAIRSFLFNLVVAERVQKGLWNHMLDGDLAMLDGTQSIFPCELPDEEIEDRCNRLDIHPSGPMPGEKGSQPGSDALELEQAVLQNWTQLTGVLQSHRVQASRRSLRLYPAKLEWAFNGDVLKLEFTLPPGTYATMVLREILVVSNAE
jgi:tRNA pseudouridine13 synthase